MCKHEKKTLKALSLTAVEAMWPVNLIWLWRTQKPKAIGLIVIQESSNSLERIFSMLHGKNNNKLLPAFEPTQRKCLQLGKQCSNENIFFILVVRRVFEDPENTDRTAAGAFQTTLWFSEHLWPDDMVNHEVTNCHQATRINSHGQMQGKGFLLRYFLQWPGLYKKNKKIWLVGYSWSVSDETSDFHSWKWFLRSWNILLLWSSPPPS